MPSRSAKGRRRRKNPGRWEGDLLSGGKNSYIATLVEQHSRFVMLIKVPIKETEAVVAAFSQHVGKLPAILMRVGCRQVLRRPSEPAAIIGLLASRATSARN